MRPLNRFQACILAIVATLTAPLASANTWVVNAPGAARDTQPGDGLCATGDMVQTPAGVIDMCTLAAAIDEANSDTGFDEIVFSQDLNANNPPFITLAIQPGLEITSPVLIDGYTAPGYNMADPEQAPIINLPVGFGARDGIALRPGAAGTTIRGLAIYDASINGILIDASDTVVQGSHIGLARGTQVEGNGQAGIRIEASAENVIIGLQDSPTGRTGRHNVVSASGTHGLHISSLSAMIAGNRIGTDATGTAMDSDGVATGNARSGIWNAGGGGVVTNNTISGNGESGIVAIPSDTNAGYHELEFTDNRLGTDISGQYALPNANVGIEVGTRLSGESTYVARNVISGNGNGGIRLSGQGGAGGTASYVLIETNRIGVTADARFALPNGGHGVVVAERSYDIVVRDNVIGGNTGSGVQFYADAAYLPVPRANVASGNWIGTNEAGTRLGNGRFGIETLASYVQIGGTQPGEGNVIGDNALGGIELRGTAIGMTIVGNYIGTNERGENLRNFGHGINVSSQHTIGGPTPGAGNVIGFNTGDGIHVIGDYNRFLGNFIGTDPFGRDLGNSGDGISLHSTTLSFASSKENVIGAEWIATPEAVEAGRNVIAFNGGMGIELDKSPNSLALVRDNAIRGNTLLLNGSLGIDLYPAGFTANGSGSHRQNFPVIDAAQTRVTAAGELEVRYLVDSDFGTSTFPLIVDFYLADGDLQEGWVHVGSHQYNAVDAGSYVTATIAPKAGSVIAGHMVATATDASYPGKTSEFSPSVLLTPTGPCGDVNHDGAVDVLDAHAVRAFLADPPGNPLPSNGSIRCGIVGGDGSCTLTDALVLTRFTVGQALEPGIPPGCAAN